MNIIFYIPFFGYILAQCYYKYLNLGDASKIPYTTLQVYTVWQIISSVILLLIILL